MLLLLKIAIFVVYGLLDPVGLVACAGCLNMLEELYNLIVTLCRRIRAAIN